MNPSFTARQGEYLAFIHRYALKNGIAPSFDEIAAHFGTTSPSVNGMIKTLERRGLLSRIPGAARSLRVLVPESLLPHGAYGSRAPRAPSARGEAGGVTVTDAAVAAAGAVLDVLMPGLAPGAETSDLVLRAALEVQKALARAGASPEESQQAARRVAAEAARWQPDGRGISVRRWRWGRRR